MNDAVIMGAALLAQTPKIEPAFEVRTEDGHVFKVFANGEIEGFPPGAVIVNRIPKHAAEAVAWDRRYREHSSEWFSA